MTLDFFPDAITLVAAIIAPGAGAFAFAVSLAIAGPAIWEIQELKTGLIVTYGFDLFPVSEGQRTIKLKRL